MRIVECNGTVRAPFRIGRKFLLYYVDDRIDIDLEFRRDRYCMRQGETLLVRPAEVWYHDFTDTAMESQQPQGSARRPADHDGL